MPSQLLVAVTHSRKIEGDIPMATMAAAAKDRRYARHLEGIVASAAGTMIEWYDFYIFGRSPPSSRRSSIPQGQQHARADRLPGDLRRRLRRAAIRRALLRTNRRSGRSQICLPGHAADHGRRDGADRLPANLRDDRHTRADPADCDPHPARAGAGRRVRRRGHICGRACAGSTSAASTPASSRSRRHWACSSRWPSS